MVNRRAALISILASMVAGLLLLGCEFPLPFGAGATSEPPAPEAAKTAAPALADVVAAEGVVVPHKEADLSFKVSGRVAEILVAEGEAVMRGQELARMETRDLEQAVLEAEARLKSVQAALAKARAGARPEEVAAAQAAVAIAQAGVRVAERAAGVAESTLEARKADVRAAEDAANVIQGDLAAAQATQSSAQARLDKLLAGATDRDIQLAEKQVDLANGQVFRVEQRRDALGLSTADIAAARTRVDIAKLELAQIKDPARPEDVAMARAEVAQARADIQTIRAQLAQAQLEVAQAGSVVGTAEAELEEARAGVEKAESEVGQAQAELELVEAGSREEDIVVAEAAVAQAEAVLAEAQNALDDAVLRAPFDGTVGAVYVDEGELVRSGVGAVRLGDLSRLQVETEDLSEVDVDQVRVGQAAVITADALGDLQFSGKVSQVAPVSSDNRGNTVYTVTIDLGVGQESGLLWGMSTFVEIQMQ